MTKIILLLSLLYVSPAFALDNCMTGSWASPDYEAEGINLEVYDSGINAGRFAGFFYAYDLHEHKQTWFLFSGHNDTGLANLYDITTNGGFGIDLEATEYDIGNVSIEVVDNNTLTFSYHMTLDLDRPGPVSIPWCLSAGCEGSIEYSRLTQPIPCNVE